MGTNTVLSCSQLITFPWPLLPVPFAPRLAFAEKKEEIAAYRYPGIVPGPPEGDLKLVAGRFCALRGISFALLTRSVFLDRDDERTRELRR